MARTMWLNLENSRNDLWIEAVKTACFLTNRMLTRNCKKNKTDYEVFHGSRSNFELLKIIGGRDYVQKRKHKIHGKFDSRAGRESWSDFVGIMDTGCYLKMKMQL